MPVVKGEKGREGRRQPTVVAPTMTFCGPGRACTVGAPAAEPLALSAVAPAGGPAAGGTQVVLRGHGFRSRAVLRDLGSLMQCDFGGQQVTGRLVGEPGPAGAVLQCVAPAVLVAGSISVRLSLDGGSAWLPGEAHYLYYDEPVVRGLDPRGGSSAGGTTVTVIGAGFGPYTRHLGEQIALCQFGSDRADPPTHAEDSLLKPRLFDSPLRPHYPRHVATPATILDQSTVRCRVPAATTVGDLAVEISLNGRDFSRSAPGARFVYYDNWQRPPLGSFVPSSRGAHAAARLGSSLWLFGGVGEVRLTHSLTHSLTYPHADSP